MGLVYSLGSSVHYHNGGKHDTTQVDLVLEQPRVVHLDGKTAKRRQSSKAARRRLYDSILG